MRSPGAVPLTIFSSNSKCNEFCHALVHNIFGWSQWNFAHVTTITLSWLALDFAVIHWAHFKTEHSKLWLNFRIWSKFISGMAAWCGAMYTGLMVVCVSAWWTWGGLHSHCEGEHVEGRTCDWPGDRGDLGEQGVEARLDTLDGVRVPLSALSNSSEMVELRWCSGAMIFSNMSPMTWKLGSTMKSMKPVYTLNMVSDGNRLQVCWDR